MKIGDTVLVTAISEAVYNEHARKVIERTPCDPFLAVITGRARKLLGKYVAGSDSAYECDPPHLRVSGSKTLWLVRVGLENREIAVDECDCEIQSEAMKLPTRGRNPKLHRTPHEVIL